MKIKNLIAVSLSVLSLAGAVSYNVPETLDFFIAADAAGDCCSFDSSTGLLTLQGNIIAEEITGFGDKASVKSIKADAGAVLPANCAGLFSYYSECTEIDLSDVDSGNVTNMISMFKSCSSLTTLNLSGFDTANVTSMKYLFDSCSSLSFLDLSSFDTSSVTDVSRMFYSCSSLISLDLTSFDTSSVDTMYDMFSGCTSLNYLDISSFDTANVGDMYALFRNCSALDTLKIGEKFGNISSGCWLSNSPGWVNENDTSIIISGDGENAVIANSGTNTYIRFKADNELAIGDVNADSVIDASDASAVLKEYAALSTGSDSTFTNEQKAAGDVNGDSIIDASDASTILRYYAYRSTGGDMDFSVFLVQK